MDNITLEKLLMREVVFVIMPYYNNEKFIQKTIAVFYRNIGDNLDG